MTAPTHESTFEAAQDARRQDNVTAVVDAIRRIMRALRVANGNAERSTGLSAAQLFVLQCAADRPGSSIAELAVETMTDRSSVAAVIERLAASGLVERRNSSSDRRRVDIVATEAGLAVLARAPHPPTTLLLDGMSALADEDLTLLATGLRSLVDAMGLSNTPVSFVFEDPREPEQL